MENLNFSKIIEIKKRIDLNIIKIQSKLDDFKKIFTKLNTEINLESSILGIDSFNFQIKIIEVQLENLNKLYLLIKNRLYKDYYKVYKNIRKNIKISQSNILKENNYPLYKDLELDKEYEFEKVVEIREEMQEYIKNLDNNINIRKKSY